MSAELSRMKVKELQDECRRLGLRATGKKAEMMERILEHRSKKRSVESKNGMNEQGKSKKMKVVNEDRWTRELEKIFHNYEDLENAGFMSEDGILALCDHIGVDAQDPVMLALSLHMKAQSMSELSREEFITGMKTLECHTIEQLKAKMPSLSKKYENDASFFAHVYAFSYGFAKEKDQKSLGVETALALWELLLVKRFPLLNDWVDYVKNHHKNAISKDVWTQTLEFTIHVKPDLSNYDENSAWPVLIDDFVAHMKEKK
ncbi:hypothetical protein THRCLA_07698 [Thraustotheca clavata]|uniref:Defective in cullin neddylation protein n=1 Tax=Thraustotheca clavata TaxID=74557 RepID=A0A1V9ZCC0_9STRA|nr:hypothetical protein THRCLA_07698 [Thraustotheca clavata]